MLPYFIHEIHSSYNKLHAFIFILNRIRHFRLSKGLGKSFIQPKTTTTSFLLQHFSSGLRYARLGLIHSRLWSCSSLHFHLIQATYSIPWKLDTITKIWSPTLYTIPFPFLLKTKTTFNTSTYILLDLWNENENETLHQFTMVAPWRGNIFPLAYCTFYGISGNKIEKQSDVTHDMNYVSLVVLIAELSHNGGWVVEL